MKKTAIFFLLAIIVILAWFFCSTEQYNGVDISHHNRVNWEALSNDSNIQFCYIKATEGKSYKDSECLGNVKEANKRNLHVGIYHYFSTHTSVKAQFDNFMSVYKRVKTDLIPAIDVEKKGNVYDNTTKDSLALLIDLFFKEFNQYPLVYLGDLEAYRTLPDINKCPLWHRTLWLSRFVPFLPMKQVGLKQFGDDPTDINYCSDINMLIRK